MKFKRSMRTVYRKDCGETYIFKNGIAKVPGVKFKHLPMTITSKEFDKITKENKECLSTLNIIGKMEKLK